MRRLMMLVGVATMAAGCASSAPSPTPSAAPAPAAGEMHELDGIRYQDIVIGAGEEMVPRRCVYTHYTGWLPDGRKFDSSRDTVARGVAPEPVAFPQGAKRVIDGWEVGFAGMRVGGKRRLFVPYQMGYGDKGSPPTIPARADLVFEVELMAVAPQVRRDEAFAGRSAPQCPPWRTVNGR
ncbi:MAG: FKBP-type peptidyl-prolyl cis-trans isomerase [bacterium]